MENEKDTEAFLRDEIKALGERLMMLIYDRVNWLQWSRSKASEHGDPPLPLDKLLEQSAEQAEEQRLMGFDDPEELLRYLGYKK